MTPRPPLIALLAAALVLTAPTAVATHWYVPSGSCPTIQSGLDSALGGDTVHVAAGIYHERLVWPNRNGIALIGAGMDSTTVDADDFEVVLYMVGNASAPSLPSTSNTPPAHILGRLDELAVEAVPIDSLTVLERIRFRLGHDAGVAISAAAPTIVECAMDSTVAGPGLYCVIGATARVTNCRMRDNAAAGVALYGCTGRSDIRKLISEYNAGDGIETTFSDLQLHRCISRNNLRAGASCTASTFKSDSSTFSHNATGILSISTTVSLENDSLADNRYGVYINGSQSMPATLIRACRLEQCTAGMGQILYTQLTLRECDIRDNVGYGLSCSEDSVLIASNRFAHNQTSSGSALVVGGSTGKICSNQFLGNSSGWNGGGCVVEGSAVDVLSNTFDGNTAVYGGGGATISGSRSVIQGNTFTHNRASRGGGVYLSSSRQVWSTHNLFFSNSALDGGALCVDWCDSLTFQHNSVVEDSASSRGGGVFLQGVRTPAPMSHNTMIRNVAGSLGDAWFMTTCPLQASGNNIEDNGYGVYNADLLNLPDVRSNWWGAWNGPWVRSIHPQGQGDSLSTYTTNFDPWLASPDTVAPPLPPRGLTFVQYAGVPLRLVWNSVPLADLSHYRVYRGHGAAGAPFDSSFDVADTSALLVDLPVDSTLRFAVTTVDRGGEESWYSREVTTHTTPFAGTPVGDKPDVLRLAPATPNPFRGGTVLSFSLPVAQHVLLDVFDVLGRSVATLTHGRQSAGTHRVTWDGRDRAGRPASPGVYLVRLQTSTGTCTVRAVRLD